MAKLPDLGNEARIDELSSLIAKEIHRVLARYDAFAKERSPISSCKGNCKCVAASLPSPASQQAIHDDLTVLASGFVSRLVAEAGLRFDVGICGEVPPSGKVEERLARPVPEARDRKNPQIQAWAGEVAGPTFLEEHYGIPRSTLHWWQRHNDVVALRKGARKHVFPLAQFIDGRPAPGMRKVLASITNPRLAWLWLTRPSTLLQGRIPIEMLRHDLVEEVALAARAFSSSAYLAAFDIGANDEAP
ncbi:hypothetical protein [Mesorhizobium sp. GbtcB19]|uniref:antitoxin Xre/MbcA/ParS-like domain-containing protein n=1 Tax=Mesorhizobium sp. GbtcB19 TaxID=2824764 RepID=UPI001C3017EE|nr:hypothetical protein [Mesorhizobium sp. GbtcB19]